MAENSNIEWTDHTFNPVIGCTKVSPGCKNCYAERDWDRRRHVVAWGPGGTRVKTSEAYWKKPLKWNREAAGVRPRVFCASLADIFEDWWGPIHDHHGEVICHVEDGCPIGMEDVRRDLFRLIDETPNLDWLLLTKRPENIREMWPRVHGSGLFSRPNVWLGVSIESQEFVGSRLCHLHDAKRNELVETTFVSAEPLLGRVVLQGKLDGMVHNHLGEGGIDWVIAGGESGSGARPSHPDWFRGLRDQCRAAGVAFLFKQWGEYAPVSLRDAKNSSILLDIEGKQWRSCNDADYPTSPYPTYMHRVGKKAAGRQLDGVEFSEFPH